MLFVSGHGVNDGPNYRFVPTDAAWGEHSILRSSSAVPWYAFQEALTGANGRRVLFLDTCHAGNAFNQRLLSDSYEANIMVYSSARGDQEALEAPSFGGAWGVHLRAGGRRERRRARRRGRGAGRWVARFREGARGRACGQAGARAGAAIFPRPRRGELCAGAAAVKRARPVADSLGKSVNLEQETVRWQDRKVPLTPAAVTAGS